jgi:hypothetical protein
MRKAEATAVLTDRGPCDSSSMKRRSGHASCLLPVHDTSRMTPARERRCADRGTSRILRDPKAPCELRRRGSSCTQPLRRPSAARGSSCRSHGLCSLARAVSHGTSDRCFVLEQAHAGVRRGTRRSPDARRSPRLHRPSPRDSCCRRPYRRPPARSRAACDTLRKPSRRETRFRTLLRNDRTSTLSECLVAAPRGADRGSRCMTRRRPTSPMVSGDQRVRSHGSRHRRTLDCRERRVGCGSSCIADGPARSIPQERARSGGMTRTASRGTSRSRASDGSSRTSRGPSRKQPMPARSGREKRGTFGRCRELHRPLRAGGRDSSYSRFHPRARRGPVTSPCDMSCMAQTAAMGPRGAGGTAGNHCSCRGRRLPVSYLGRHGGNRDTGSLQRQGVRLRRLRRLRRRRPSSAPTSPPQTCDKRCNRPSHPVRSARELAHSHERRPLLFHDRNGTGPATRHPWSFR